MSKDPSHNNESPYPQGVQQTILNLKVNLQKKVPSEFLDTLNEFRSNSKFIKVKHEINDRKSFLACISLFWDQLNTPKPLKKQFVNILNHIRRAALSNYYLQYKNSSPTPMEIIFLQEVAHSFYCANSLISWLRELPRKVIAATKEPHDIVHSPPPSKNQSQVQLVLDKLNELEKLYPQIKQASKHVGYPRLKRYYMVYKGGVTWGKFDPNKAMSLVNVKMTAQNKVSASKTFFIRMSSPTIGGSKKTQVTPEFLLYLDYLERNNLTHTYINLQDQRGKSSKDRTSILDHSKRVGINDESFRSMSLAKIKSLYPQSFEFVSLSRNNSIYFQRGRYQKKKFAKKEFLDSLKNEIFSTADNGITLPESWHTNAQQRQKIDLILKTVAHAFYGDVEELSKKQRITLVEIVYFLITMAAIEGSHSTNITCKDGIDRAGAANGVVFTALFAQQISMGMDTASFLQQLDFLEGMIFSDALSVKNRAIMKNRFTFFINSTRLIFEKMHQGADLSAFFALIPFGEYQLGCVKDISS